MDLCRGALIADISHVGGAGVEGGALIQRHQEVVEVVGLHGLHLFGEGGIVLRAHAAGEVTPLVGGGQGLHESVLLRRAGRYAQLGEVVVQHLLQRVVAHGVGQAVHEAALDGGVRHQRRALRDLVHPLVQGHAVLDEVGTDHVQDAGLVLHHVGAYAACVQNGVVHPGVAGHMLPQELHAHIHQLYRVQRAAAPLRRGGCLGRQPVERVDHLDAGVGGAGSHLAAVAGVPRQRRVKAVPQALPSHIGLGRHALLAGAAVQDDGAAFSGLGQIVLQADGGGHGPRAQQIVAAAVAAAALHQFVVRGAARRLRKAGQRIVLRQQANDRPTAAEGGGEGGGDAAYALLHLKALSLQHLDEQGGGLYLLHGQLGIVPDGVRHLCHQFLLLVNGGQRRLFCIVHCLLLFHSTFFRKS